MPACLNMYWQILLLPQASMLEIYNEEYKDLLGKGPPAGKKHQVCVALVCTCKWLTSS